MYVAAYFSRYFFSWCVKHIQIRRYDETGNVDIVYVFAN
jgi:hypothetical protein